METNIINVHTHIFNKRNVPAKFLPFFLRPLATWLQNEKIANVFSWISEKIFRQKHWAELIDKYHTFVSIGEEKTQREVLEDLIKQYPAGTKFAILPMDMEFMGAGTVEQSYEDQLKELALLKRDPKFQDIIFPFIFVHPERSNILEIVKHYIEVENFSGIKMYPPLGYYPFDERLDKVYEYAQEKKIPITTHCSRGGVYYRGKITSDMTIHPKTGKRIPYNGDNSVFCQVYTDPANYEYVLEKFPNLVLNFAHFGGYREWYKFLSNSRPPESISWLEKIVELIKHYPAVYSDISYTMYSPDMYPQLKTLMQDEGINSKILFGSDFYMVEQETTEKEFYLCLRSYLGEIDFNKLAELNPKVFLRRP